MQGTGPALARLTITVDGVRHELSEVPIAWERALGWIPTFTCSICGEPSTEICHRCTKDVCPNHACDKCFCCSDCCACDLRRKED